MAIEAVCRGRTGGGKVEEKPKRLEAGHRYNNCTGLKASTGSEDESRLGQRPSLVMKLVAKYPHLSGMSSAGYWQLLCC